MSLRRIRRYASSALVPLVLSFAGYAQQGDGGAYSNYMVLPKGESLDEIVRDAAHVVPSPRQWEWQKMEFIGFIHFGMNTFVNQEWGNGSANPALFNPTAFNPHQWVETAKQAGMKMLILTAKHHDGFCLWPTKYTNYSVRKSPWKNGKGDVVKEVADACREGGLKFGIYLSPWDRHEPTYGDSPKYNQHFRDQLRELLTNYGEIAEVWFDGANGEGPNGKKQVYDWKSYYSLIRELQPNAVIAIMGPDVRWVGTESGYGRDTEWSVLPAADINMDSIAAHSQQVPLDAAFVPRDLMGEDLGSRDRLRGATALAWYPAESDVSIRPGWFYRASEDARVKSPQKLVDIYYSSVGRNSVLLLNVPPDKRGLICRSDIASLKGMHAILKQTFATNLLAGAHIEASNERKGHEAMTMIDGDGSTYWITDEGVDSAVIRFDLARKETMDRALLQEYVRAGQRIERFHFDAWDGVSWVRFASGTTVGYKRLLRFAPVTTSAVRLVIEQSRWSPSLSAVGLFASPPVVRATPDGGPFGDSVRVSLNVDRGEFPIHFTLDGSSPTLQSPLYSGSIVLRRSTTVKAIPEVSGEAGGEGLEARFTRCWPAHSIALEQTFSPKYPASGPATLIDGKRGNPDELNKDWLGFEGQNLTAILDLGKVQTIHTVTLGCLQRQNSWVFLPKEIQVAVSSDRTRWKNVTRKTHPLKKSDNVSTRDFTATIKPVDARYVKIIATNPGTCPPWHPGAGGKAWMFVDEIVVK